MTGSAERNRIYPETENWQKALGEYDLWSAAEVKKNGEEILMIIAVHVNDRFNFDRDKFDIATGEPDDTNGRFQQLGWPTHLIPIAPQPSE